MKRKLAEILPVIMLLLVLPMGTFQKTKMRNKLQHLSKKKQH